MSIIAQLANSKLRRTGIVSGVYEPSLFYGQPLYSAISMPAGLIEWFAKRLALERLKRRIFSTESAEDREIESELYDAFVTDYGEIVLKPTGVDKSEEVHDDLRGDIVNLVVERDDSTTITALDISLDEAALDHLPVEEERVENAVNFWLEKDDLSVTFDEKSRVGPLLTIYVPSTRKGDVKGGIEAVSEILARLIHTDDHLWHFIYEHIEAGHDLDRYLDDSQEVEELREEIGDDEFEELMRYLAGSFSGHDPELNVDESD